MICHSQVNITRHHVIPKMVRRYFKDVSQAVTIPLCRSCHDAIETSLKSRYLEYRPKVDFVFKYRYDVTKIQFHKSLWKFLALSSYDDIKGFYLELNNKAIDNRKRKTSLINQRVANSLI